MVRLIKSGGVAALLTGFLFSTATLGADDDFNIGDRIPRSAHIAVWVDDMDEAMEAMKSNGYVTLLSQPTGGVGEGDAAISRTIQRLPISIADPMYTVWDSLLPFIDSGLRGGAESATTVFHFSADDLAETFSDSIALYSTKYDLFVENGIEIVEWDVILAAEYQPEEKERIDAFLEKALSRVPREARRKTVEYAGEEVYHITYYLDEEASLPGDEDNSLELGLIQEIPVIVEYGFVDNVFYLAEGRGEPLGRAIRALKGTDGGETLADRSDFRRAESALPGNAGQVHFYFDLPHHVEELRDFPSQSRNADFLSALGLDSAGVFLAALSFEQKQARLDSVLVPRGEPRGILSAVAKSPDNSLDRVKLTPGDAELIGSLSFDFVELYDQYLTAMSSLNASSRSMADALVAGIEQATTINLRQDLLNRCSGEMLTYVRPSAATEGQGGLGYAAAYFVPLHGDAQTTAAFNKILQSITIEQVRLLDLESNDFEGVTIWEPPDGSASAASGAGLHLAATSEGIIMTSSGAEIRRLLRAMNGRDGESIMANQFFARFMGGISRGGLRGFVYMPAKTVVDDYMRKLRATNRLADPATLPQRAEVEMYLGPAWWNMHYVDGNLLYTFVVDSPDYSGQ